jgi:hypothetical protein
MQNRPPTPLPTLQPTPNPRGNQTLPQPTPATPRTPDGRFAPEFRPHPPLTPITGRS